MKAEKKKMKQSKFPPGWNEKRVKKVLAYYENQSEEESVRRISMSTKDLILKEIEQIPESYLGRVLEMVHNFRENNVRMFKGRPILRKEDINEKTWPYPPEPDCEEVWKELNQE